MPRTKSLRLPSDGVLWSASVIRMMFSLHRDGVTGVIVEISPHMTGGGRFTTAGVRVSSWRYATRSPLRANLKMESFLESASVGTLLATLADAPGYAFAAPPVAADTSEYGLWDPNGTLHLASQGVSLDVDMAASKRQWTGRSPWEADGRTKLFFASDPLVRGRAAILGRQEAVWKTMPFMFMHDGKERWVGERNISQLGSLLARTLLSGDHVGRFDLHTRTEWVRKGIARNPDVAALWLEINPDVPLALVPADLAPILRSADPNVRLRGQEHLTRLQKQASLPAAPPPTPR